MWNDLTISWNELTILDRKKIIAVMDTTFAVVKRKPEKNQACTGLELVTSAIPMQRSNQLSQQANWELVIWSVLYKPVKSKDERMNI